MQVTGRWWEPKFSLLEREVAENHGDLEDDPWGPGLDVETLGGIYVQLNIGTDGYMPKYLQVSVCTRVSVHACLSSLCQLREPGGSNSTMTTRTPNTQTWCPHAILHREEQGSVGEWLILKLERIFHVMALEHSLMPQTGSAQNQLTNQPTKTQPWGNVTGTQDPDGTSPLMKPEIVWATNG